MSKKINLKQIQKLMRNKKKVPEKKVSYLLETTSPDAIKYAKSLSDNLVSYNWKYYSELAQQREKSIEKIKNSLIESSAKFEFNHWQRAVKWRYSNHPLCAMGSQTFVGQRFNFGDDINSMLSGFPALYFACDKDTALQETLGQSSQNTLGLSAKEVALTNPQSESIVSVSGVLDSVIDLRTEKSLKKFVQIISKFKISEEIKKLAKELGDEIGLVTTTKALKETLLENEWHYRPVQYQVPANSQIFGHLVYLAGIQGIVYPSKVTKKDCLVLFPLNFKNTESFVKFDDHPPDDRMPTKIDASNFNLTMKTHKQIITNSN